MASPTLVLPGVLFVGEDERARLVAHLGPAAGWMIPKGVLAWSHEVSVVARDTLSEAVRRDAKIVMPEEQIPPAKLPLAHQAALKSPLVAVSSRLTQKLVDAGIRVHTVGADRVTSSFYYIAEGGGEDPVRVEGDLVAAVGAMLGDRADNAAIERVLDGIADRLVRSLSKDRITELSLELAAALPRAAADGTGTQDVDLDAFEKELSTLVGDSEKYSKHLGEIANKITATNERKVDIPLYGDARKVSQGPFDLEVGAQKVALVTHERWLATGPLTEPTAAAAAPEPAPTPKSEPTPQPKATTPKPTVTTTPSGNPPANMRPLAAPLNPPRPKSEPPKTDSARIEPTRVEMVQGSAAPEPAPAPVSEPPPKTEPVPAVAAATAPAPVKIQSGKTELMVRPEMPKVEPAKAEPVKAVPAAAPAPKVEPVAAKASTEPKAEPAKAIVRDASRTATTQKVPRQEKGFPWLIVLLILAAGGFAIWRFILHH